MITILTIIQLSRETWDACFLFSLINRMISILYCENILCDGLSLDDSFGRRWREVDDWFTWLQIIIKQCLWVGHSRINIMMNKLRNFRDFNKIWLFLKFVAEFNSTLKNWFIRWVFFSFINMYFKYILSDVRFLIHVINPNIIEFNVLI